MFSQNTRDAIKQLLVKHEEDGYTRGLFDPQQIDGILAALEDLAPWLSAHKPERIRQAEQDFSPQRRFSHRHALCIAYIDHIAANGDDDPAAVRLRKFFNSQLAGQYSHLHILPHFPCPLIHPELPGPAGRADGGFEPMTYRMDPKYGAPEDLQAIQADLMYDFVLNHLSVKGEWFQGFLEDRPEFADFFLTIPEDRIEGLDLSQVFRPRQHHPIFEFVNTAGETKHVWCTFSATQADINIKNSRVFIKVMESLVKDFVGAGASWIRLDAVGYLVKLLGLETGEPRGTCFGEPETHNLLKAVNRVLGEVAPAVTLVAEVNAPKDVIATYYGEEGDESHMVYEFPIAPLSLFATYTGNASPVMAWAQERLAHPERIGLAFTNSHDGIGVLPMKDVAPLADGTPALDVLIQEVTRRHAGINYKRQMVDGQPTDVPYEACITWAQAILTPEELTSLKRDALDDAAIQLIADRFIASQSYAFSVPHCVPADYLGAIAVLLNDEQTFEATDHNRNKNRGLINATAFERALKNPKTNRDKLVRAVFERKTRILAARRSSQAFSPYAPCRVDVVEVDGAGDGFNPVFSVLRRSPDGTETLLALTNSGDPPQSLTIRPQQLGMAPDGSLADLLSDRRISLDGREVRLELMPWQVSWLRVE